MVLSAKARRLQPLLVLFLVVGGLDAALAVNREPPPGVTIIHAEELIQLALTHGDVIVIDSRAAADRELGYIEGSINLPDDQTSCETLSSLVKRADYHLVFYCNGVNCVRSYRAVEKASGCGYSNIYWFKGGYEEWREKHFPVLKAR